MSEYKFQACATIEAFNGYDALPVIIRGNDLSDAMGRVTGYAAYIRRMPSYAPFTVIPVTVNRVLQPQEPGWF
jgi:hypothetical protein